MSNTSERLKHTIFQHYTASGNITAWYGVVPTPYRAYNGYGVLIGGTCDPTAARKLVRNEQMVPALTEDRRALVALWICDYTDASLGGHTQLQFSMFMAPKPISNILAHPFSLVQAMHDRNEFYMMAHGLWNNTEKAASYNNEVLALPARLAESTITRLPKRFDFSFRARNGSGENALICNGSLKDNGRAPVADQLEYFRLVGYTRARELQQLPFRNLNAINPVGGAFARNEPTEVALTNDREWLRMWDPKADHISMEDPLYADLDLQFDFVQRFDGMRFVYTTPRSVKLDHMKVTEADASIGQHQLTPV